jgi:hypothetical protein
MIADKSSQCANEIQEGVQRDSSGSAAEIPLNLQRRGRPFEKGQSGNPGGKPKETRNRTTAIAQNLLDGEAETLGRKVVELALGGDLACLRICLERLVPPKKDAPIDMNVPQIESVGDIPKLLDAVAAKISDGGITPSEVKVIIDLADAFRKALEVADLEVRISRLEEEMRPRM